MWWSLIGGVGGVGLIGEGVWWSFIGGWGGVGLIGRGGVVEFDWRRWCGGV